MPLKTDLNVAPYFDDYNEDNAYYRILFRPQVALQARELTQVQSMLQTQIERFGDWAFRNGDIVSGCNIIDIPALPFIRLQDFQTNGASFDATALANLQVISASSNLAARVFISNSGLSSNYPNTNVIYVQYINTGNSGQTSFANNETLNFYSIPAGANATYSINSYSNSTANQVSIGNAHGISVSEGVAYLNGEFVKVLAPTFGIVNNFGGYAGNNVVGFQLVETIITENQDSSLNDNALGYSNENAPGAHRLKLIPTLITLDPSTASNTSGFNPIAIYNYGGLIAKEHASSNLYSVVGAAIAQRIYDESGNYVVNPFVVDTVTGGTGTSVIAALDANSVLGRIGPGVGYAQGQRVEILKSAYINMRRGIDTTSFNSQFITFNYGNYFVVNEAAGIFPFTNAETVNLYDKPQRAVTLRNFAGLTANGNVIGTASVRNFNYVSGVPGTNTATFYVHVFNIKMANNFQTNQIKSIGYVSGTKGYADVTSDGVVGSSTKNQLYSFGYTGLKNLRDNTGNINTQYTYRTISSGTLSTGGNTTITLTSSAAGGNDIMAFGISAALAPSDAATFTLVATANVDTAALTGTVNVSSVSTNVTGTSTTFLNDFAIGDLIKVNSTIRTVAAVTNSTVLTVDSVFATNATAQTYNKSYLNGKIIPFQYSANGSATGYVSVTNTTSFTISTTQRPASGLGVQVYYDVQRTTTTPATKVINKNRFVKINVSNNAAGPNGPWCLGVSDVHKLTAVYGSADGSYTTSGLNLTSSFSFDTGQKDTHYDLAYLYPAGGYNSTSYPYLLVQMDYFTPNTSPGCGFFTVESYPIDDANTSNTTAIQTKDIPLYIDEAGQKIWLRDYVDFRPVGTLVANNTGTVNTSNSTQVTTAISYSTINPISTVSFSIPAGGLNVPAYGENMQSDYTIYLPRKDLITITSDNKIKIIEGVSSVAPQTPLFPDNSMSVAVLNIPAYPSLSTDQADSNLSINKTARNLIRDTSGAINTSLVTNRRYTMSDIGKLDKRISNLEYYTQLSLLQQKATKMTITDANGLNRFKNGIFVESFDDFTLSDVSNPEYSIAIDERNSLARPKFVLEKFKFTYNASVSTNVQKTGRALTLPYTSITFINQPYATKYRSAAHVASHWSGSLQLMPTYNNNIDQNQTASVGITIDNAKPWAQFANSPFGSIWGSWQTSTNSVSSSVTSGTANTYNVNLGYQGGQDSAEDALNKAIQQYQAQGFVIGGQSFGFRPSGGAIGSNASITQIS